MSGRDDDRLVYSSEHGPTTAHRERPPRDRRHAGRERARPPAGPDDGVARVRREKKGRRGKTVTTVSGLRLAEPELRDLASELKRRCGSGGSLVEGVVEIQGDHVDAVIAELLARGLKAKRAGG